MRISCECLDKVDVYMLGLTAMEAIKGRPLTEDERDRVRLGEERCASVLLRGEEARE